MLAYAKAFVAVVAAALVTLNEVLPEGSVIGQEWTNVVVTFAAALGVYGVRNRTT